jgi:hypothetical protein
MTTFQDLADRKAREREAKLAAKPKTARPAKRYSSGRKPMSDEEIKKWRERNIPKDTAAIQKAEETAPREADLAETPPAPAENLILQVAPEGSDLQQDFELLLRYTVSYQGEKTLAGARPGWGTVQLASINAWDLCRKPRPTPSFIGWNLTVDPMPTVPTSELIEATRRLERSIAQLLELEVLGPGRCPGTHAIFYGRSAVGGALEHDPRPGASGPRRV